MDFGIIEIDRGKRGPGRQASVVVELVCDGEPEQSIAVRFLGFESWALVRGIDPAGITCRSADDVPAVVRSLPAWRGFLLALLVFLRMAARYPRRSLASLDGMIRFLGGGARPSSYLVSESGSGGDRYRRWIAKNEDASGGDAALDPEAMRRRFSVVIAFADPDLSLFKECLRSVAAQSYTNHEICLSGAAPGGGEVSRFLRSMDEKNENVRILLAEEGASVSKLMNDAAALGEGEYIVFLDPEDRLAADALLEINRIIETHPGAALIYSDEDMIDGDGARHSPRFKPAWSPDLLRSCNYIGHLTCVKRSVFEEAGGFREGYEGAHLHDLLLRVSEAAGKDRIERVSKVLYHRRNRAGAMPENPEQAGKAIRSQLERLGLRGRVTPERGVLRVRYDPEKTPLVSIIILTRDRADLLSACVESVLGKTDYGNFEIVIVDNGSTEAATFDLLEKFEKKSHIRIVRDDSPFNFSRLNNIAAEQARGDHLCFLNNDIEVIGANWLAEMTSHSARAGVGCVGAKLRYPNGQIQHAGIVTGLGGISGHAHKYFPRDAAGYLGRLRAVQNVSAVTAACLVVDRALFERVGRFREELPLAYNDVDLCLRVREEGLFNVWTPYAELYHHESLSRGREDTPEKKERLARESELMRELWGVTLVDDPFYSPNLSLEREDFAIRV